MKLMALLAQWRERWGPSSRSKLNPRYLYGVLNALGSRLIESPLWALPGVVIATAIGGVMGVFLITTIPFLLTEQLVFSVVFCAVALYIRRYVGTLVVLVLISMSLIASTRYLFWRFTATLGHEVNLDLIFGLGLLAAELYAWLVLVLGFFQTAWPLKRKPALMPQDLSLWPTVDIFIPTYDEPLSVVRRGEPALLDVIAQPRYRWGARPSWPLWHWTGRATRSRSMFLTTGGDRSFGNLPNPSVRRT